MSWLALGLVSGFALGLCVSWIARLAVRYWNLAQREQAVIEAEHILRQRALEAASEAQAAIHEIQVEDRLAMENDTTVLTLKVEQ